MKGGGGAVGADHRVLIHVLKQEQMYKETGTGGVLWDDRKSNNRKQDETTPCFGTCTI